MAARRLLTLPQRVAASAVFVTLGAIGFLPLFGGPGYEQSLATGVVAPAAAAIATAVEVSAEPMAPLAGVGRGVASGALVATAALATALLHGLRVGICDFSGGILLFALGGGWGALMGGVWGAVVAEVCRGRRRRRLAGAILVLAALAGPALGIAVSVVRFYTSPMIFAFDPFFGFFSGALYDTIVDERLELWTYRAGSLATLVGVALVASSLVRTERGTLSFGAVRFRSAAAVRLLLGAAALAASLVLAAEGPRLGHFQTTESIAQALGGRASGPRCDLVYPDSLLAEQSVLLLRDCEQELAADEARLGAHLDGRLTAYVFRDANEKRVLMGAAQTSIAKPWRREVYVQVAGFPHPVLGHEIAHVVAGVFGSGPFRVAGAAGGLWPNPGLIEGVAVAAAPDDDELTDAQWARAMLDLGTLPPIERLFSVGFLGENAAKSYTVAGAFVTWVLDGWGSGVVRAWYGGEPIERLTGKSWRALDDQFRASLRALPMPSGASAYAKAKFERPSVWARRCPHVVDALDRDGDRCRDEHRFRRASALYESALALDPRDWHARYERARIDLSSGNEALARDEFARIAAADDAPRTSRDRAEEALADVDLVRGFDGRAADGYRALAARALDEDARRTLEVKLESVDRPPARQAIIDLLIGQPGRPLDPWLAGLSLGTWAEESREPLAAYLVGKNMTLHQSYERAAVWLDAALAAAQGEVVAPPIARELLRQRAIVACALGDRAALGDTRQKVAAPDSPFSKSAGTGRRESVLRLIARCI